jgi:FRG domain
MKDFEIHPDRYFVYERKTKSLSEYLDIISTIKDCWEVKWLFYRGVKQDSLDLTPSVYRSIQGYKAERISEIFVEFKRKSRFLLDRPKTDWEYYEIMQHHGFPTRLLDWSSGSLIALFFALFDLSSCNNPSVWVLDPGWLNNWSINKNRVFNTSDRDPFLDDFLYDDRLKYLSPIAILPSTHNSRILAQKGCFTIHGKSKIALNLMLNESDNVKLAKITFDNEHIKHIKRELASTGINHSNIYPDLEGIANELRYEYDIP